MANSKNRYSRLIAAIFEKYYRKNATEVAFERGDITEMAAKLAIQLPKNLGDLLYSFRYRAALPKSITDTAPKGYEWIIRPAGRSRYRFVLVKEITILPSTVLAETKIPDATPGVITKYALSDEQSLLAKIRYNRLIDIFTGLTCYSLQNHLRTTVASVGQVETDELYVGIDKRGAHYVLTVQAKVGSDRIGIVQIEQDLAICAEKFPGLIYRPIAAQMVQDGKIVLFEFESTRDGIRVVAEKHYRLVPPDQLPPEELAKYQDRPW